MTGGVAVSCVERRDERGCEREVRLLEVGVRLDELRRQLPLLLVEAEQSLGGERRQEEQRKRPRRHVGVRDRERSDDRGVETDRNGVHRRAHSKVVHRWAPPKLESEHAKREVERLSDERGRRGRDDELGRFALRECERRCSCETGGSTVDRPDARVDAPLQELVWPSRRLPATQSAESSGKSPSSDEAETISRGERAEHRRRKDGGKDGDRDAGRACRAALGLVRRSRQRRRVRPRRAGSRVRTGVAKTSSVSASTQAARLVGEHHSCCTGRSSGSRLARAPVVPLAFPPKGS